MLGWSEIENGRVENSYRLHPPGGQTRSLEHRTAKTLQLHRRHKGVLKLKISAMPLRGTRYNCWVGPQHSNPRSWRQRLEWWAAPGACCVAGRLLHKRAHSQPPMRYWEARLSRRMNWECAASWHMSRLRRAALLCLCVFLRARGRGIRWASRVGGLRAFAQPETIVGHRRLLQMVPVRGSAFDLQHTRSRGAPRRCSPDQCWERVLVLSTRVHIQVL